MLYGKLTSSSLTEEDVFIRRLQKAIHWAEAEHYTVTFGNFEGGFFRDPRLPFTPDDFLCLDISHDVLVLMSGCLYNQTELGRTYGVSSEVANGPTPAFIAHLYLQQGLNFIDALNGDFAIVIYQPNRHNFFIIRDHVGIAPLVYTSTEQAIYFASDILALCRTFYQGGPMQIDPIVSDHKAVDMTLTPNEKVLKLKGGHILTYTDSGISIQKYWQPERIQTDNTLTKEEMFTELKGLLHHAVHIRSDQRFRAGAHLSGGFDSSTVAALARREYDRQPVFYGYSWSPSNVSLSSEDLDERELIKETGKMAGIEPIFLHVDAGDFRDLTKNSLDNFQYFYEAKVLTLAKSHKTNLLFSGWGGDEFISFGSMGVEADLFFKFQWKTFLRKHPIRNPKAIAAYLIYRVLLPAIYHVPYRVRKSYKENLRFFKKQYRTVHERTLKRYYCFRSRREFQLGMIATHHLAERTECWTITGFKNGVAYRYPLLDKRIIEYMLKVPSKLLVKDSTYTRIILRELTAGILPESVRWRKIKGDMAFHTLVEQQVKDRGLLFIDEIDDFKANPQLDFIDFETLEEEISRFRSNEKDYPESSELFRFLLEFKSIHELTKSYTQPIGV